MVRAITVGLLAAAFLVGQVALACPFCPTQGQTLTEEISTMDVLVIARLIAPPTPVETANPNDSVSKAKFEVLETLKGPEHAAVKSRVEALYYGNAEVGKEFLIMGVIEGQGDSKSQTVWSTPMAVNEKSREYLHHLGTLPKMGPERLEFFLGHFEDKEELLARDAFDEFARAPYSEVQAIKEKIPHDKLVAWIKDAEIPGSRRRLYLTMLGVCGSEKDLPFLEELLKSDSRQAKSGLDALIACYLTLEGPQGTTLVEDLFLKNPKAEYADIYAAIMALRFHATESDVVPKKQIVLALRTMLDRPPLADLVIPDLARMEDWDSLDKMVDLFKNADEKTSWVRTPVVNFVRACPLPIAKEKMKQLEEIDPAAVKRANTFFPFGPPKPPEEVKTSSSIPSPPREIPGEIQTIAAEVEIPDEKLAASATKPALLAASEPATNVKERSGPVAQAVTDSQAEAALQSASANAGAPPAAAAREKKLVAPNRWVLFGVTALSALTLMALQWTVLVGRR